MTAVSNIIAAIRSEETLEAALHSPLPTLFLLGGTLQSLPDIAAKIRKGRKNFFLHADLVDGLKCDESGVRYLAETLRPAGLISTRPATLKLAHEHGLLAVLRIFAIDSQALQTGRQNAGACHPEFVEVLPGVSRRILAKARELFPPEIPLIAGGLIATPEDLREALAGGAVAASTSNAALWRNI